jgi:hypothetical protein
MATTTMNKNIFTAFGLDETKVASVAMNKITGTGSTTKNSASASEDFVKVTREERKPKVTHKERKPLYTPKSDAVKTSQGANPLKLCDYPALGTKLTKAQNKVISSQNQTIFSKTTEAEFLDPRSASFAAMADKKKVAASLTCTKACRLVTGPHTNPKDGEQAKFGVCTRTTCSFAHSYAELQAPVCGFDGNCRFQHGKRDHKTRKILPGTQCRFRHSNEGIDDYYKRSKVQRPALPPTSEHTRKPLGATAASTPSKSTVAKPTLQYSAIPPPVHVNRSRRTTSRWDKKIDEKPRESPKPTESRPPKAGPVRSSQRQCIDSSSDDSSSDDSSSDDSSSDDSSSDDSSSDDETEHRSRKRRCRPPVKHRRSRSKTSPAAQIIRVPTKELAAVAIKAAFDRGQYNVQVLVEG